VSLKDLSEDISKAGASHDPWDFFKVADDLDESQYRYFMGPKIKNDCEAYNSYFEKTGADLIIIPAAMAATPDLEASAAGTIPLTLLQEDGSTVVEENGNLIQVFHDHMFRFKHLHIPKLVVPTGLTEDGRPTAVQVWGRAVPYDLMFDDNYSSQHDIEFLYLAQRVAAAIQANVCLKRADAPHLVKELGLARQSSGTALPPSVLGLARERSGAAGELDSDA
jgi:hypothetical protein